MNQSILANGSLHFTFEKATLEGKVALVGILVIIIAALVYWILRRE